MNTQNITFAICRELERQPFVPFSPDIPVFEGSGLYAIYYQGGSLSLYSPLSPYKIPVYVGQASSHNSATGKSKPGRSPLWKRVREHRDSIMGARLPLDEFGVRLLLLPDVHSDLGENGLRVNYQPVWNGPLNGFGSHEQGSSTRRSGRSRWDTVHPGRARTFGAERYEKDHLEERARQHIREQIAAYARVPWHQP